jgi:selenocysteine lyase/cysteine desulfurase
MIPQSGLAPDIACDDEAAWSLIRAEYDVPADFINLEHGYCGMQAKPVFAALLAHQTRINQASSYFMRQAFPQEFAAVMQQLAQLCGVEVEELVLTRNVIESMNILLQGYPFGAGDEVIMAAHDYDKVLETLSMVAQRRQLRLVEVSLPLDPVSDEQIVQCYEEQITPKTRAILVTHLVHLTGQILPVAKICAMARSKGVDVLVDSAHAFAHLDFTLPNLGADFVAVNLHKWLGAPLGLGLLYVRKNRITEIAPFYGDVTHAANDINKLASFGTLAPAPIVTIADAIAFHYRVGARNKEARLRYLARYWREQVDGLPGLEWLTPRAPERHGAIVSFSIQDMAAQQVVDKLMQQYRIFSVMRPLAGRELVRITPALCTSCEQLDVLVMALKEICSY